MVLGAAEVVDEAEVHDEGVVHPEGTEVEVEAVAHEHRVRGQELLQGALDVLEADGGGVHHGRRDARVAREVVGDGGPRPDEAVQHHPPLPVHHRDPRQRLPRRLP